jgi:iron complex outermembrane receptor protein
MMKRFFLCLVAGSLTTVSLCVSPLVEAQAASKPVAPWVPAGEPVDTASHELDEVLVTAARADRTTPVAQTNLQAKEIKALTVATNLPHVLWMTPSLVATSENGTGAGYSSMRIRGTDASRINVTLNGIPLNNPESQEVYWVNLPDMTSALQSLQVQRGVGTSTNGSGAFGASINMTTAGGRAASSLETATTVGSYGTFQQNIALSTGQFGRGFSLDLRYSNLTSDGYLRNGWLDHESLFAALVKRFDRSTLWINYMYGNQHTGITWEGISDAQMAVDPTFNPAGEIKEGVYYDNESDNYRQHHFQAFYTQALGEQWLLNAGLNYTDGFGYYEQYKQGKSFSGMGLPNQTVEGVTYASTDLIRRKNMDNGFYTGHLNLNYHSSRLTWQTGAMYTYYDGDHFATLRWVEHNENLGADREWVRNNGEKTDANVFTKVSYSPLAGLSTYVDLQYRYVRHALSGIDDDDMLDMTQSRNWNFFNPKVGVYYDLSTNNAVFASVGVAHREPTRADLKDAFKLGSTSQIRPERLTDVELGYTFDNHVVMAGVNLYYMRYKDQLVPTGKLNEVGYKLMGNIEKSYRAGVELQAGYRPLDRLSLEANATFSRNKALDYTAWYETYDNSNDWGDAPQLSRYFKEASLPFSPEAMGAFRVIWKPLDALSVTFTKKWVSSQYITNTQNSDLMLPAYTAANASLVYGFDVRGVTKASLGLYVDNLASRRYSSNAWGYEAHFANGDPTYVEKGLYPVAPRHYLVKFVLQF